MLAASASNSARSFAVILDAGRTTRRPTTRRCRTAARARSPSATLSGVSPPARMHRAARARSPPRASQSTRRAGAAALHRIVRVEQQHRSAGHSSTRSSTSPVSVDRLDHRRASERAQIAASRRRAAARRRRPRHRAACVRRRRAGWFDEHADRRHERRQRRRRSPARRIGVDRRAGSSARRRTRSPSRRARRPARASSSARDAADLHDDHAAAASAAPMQQRRERRARDPASVMNRSPIRNAR